MHANEHLIGELIDGKYRIDKLLGKGGMGAVYLATHMGTDRPVALKVITPQFMRSDEFVARFQREARAAGRLRHPNVVNVTDFGFARVNDDRVAYLVMEYLDGCTLAEVLEEESRLPLEWVVDILEQACSALEEAHRQGVIHRDLKPDNIWLEPNRRGGYTVKVLDFGLAKLADPTPSLPAPEGGCAPKASLAGMAPQREETPSVVAAMLHLPPNPSQSPEAATQLQPGGAPLIRHNDDEARTLMLDLQTMSPDRHTKPQRDATRTASTDGLTRVGSIMGTPLYMSPEQCRGEALDARSDIYNLGVIAYQMLAGETPFKGDMTAVMKMHIEQPPPPLREKRKDIPKKVAKVVMSALAKNPDERPARPASFASALRAYAERPGGLLRRALTLASEHFPTFLRLVLIVYTPFILATLAGSLADWLTYFGVVPKGPGTVITQCMSVINWVITVLTVTVLLGMTSRVVTQLLSAPLRRIQLRPAFAALRKRLWPFIVTTLRMEFTLILLLILGVIPGILFAINSAFMAPVVLIEGLKGKAALARSKVLAKRAKRIVIMILLIEVVVPTVSGGLLAFFIAVLVKSLGVGGGETGTPQIRHRNVSITIGGGAPTAVARIMTLVAIPINLFFHMLSSILTSLLYLTTRQAGGETLKEALSQFEEEEMPRTKWQQRMRERQLTSLGSRQVNTGKPEA